MLREELLRKSTSASVDNDLTFYASVLSEINYVINKTYGPEAGYVAQHVPDTGGGSFTYTKDGLTTLNTLVFDERADQYVLNMVKELANVIKKTSGDGSTTATKLIYYLIKNALERSLEKDLYKYRINTPKAIEVIMKDIKKAAEHWTLTNPSFNDLRDAARISLNNDDNLMGPIDTLLKHLEESNAPLDSTLKIEAYKSYNDETTVTNNTGYLIGMKHFTINSEMTEVQNAKVVILPSFLTASMMFFIIKHLMELAQEHSKGIKIIFIVNSVEDQLKNFFKTTYREMQTKDVEILFDIIELEHAFTTTDSKLEDLSYLLNANIINLNEYVEVRDTIRPGSHIDNPNTTNLVKWKAANKPILDENGKKIGEEFDENYYRDIFTDVYLDNLVNSFFCDIKLIPTLGLTIAPSKYATDKQIKEEHKKLLNNHIARLKEVANSNDIELANDAKFRLYSLQDNLHVINVAKRIVDDERIYTAYKDAAKALTSIVTHGYYMGGSVGLYIILSYARKQFSKLPQTLPEDVHNTVYFLYDLLMDSVENVIQDLKYDFRGKTFNELVNEERIDFSNDTIDGINVIVPVETDLVMVPNVLYLFSNMFASLLINFSNSTDAGRAKYVSRLVLNAIEDDKKDNAPEPIESAVEEEIPEEHVEENIDDSFSPILPTSPLNISDEEIPSEEPEEVSFENEFEESDDDNTDELFTDFTDEDINDSDDSLAEKYTYKDEEIADDDFLNNIMYGDNDDYFSEFKVDEDMEDNDETYEDFPVEFEDEEEDNYSFEEKEEEFEEIKKEDIIPQPVEKQRDMNNDLNTREETTEELLARLEQEYTSNYKTPQQLLEEEVERELLLAKSGSTAYMYNIKPDVKR